jgi:DnaJ-class molecular chaperone
MNFNRAKDLLGLPDDFNQDLVRQKYHQLSLKHHPDKGGNPDDFVEITQAHDFLTKNEKQRPQGSKPQVVNLNDIFKTFINTSASALFTTKKSDFFGFKRQIEIIISPREFLEGGTTREIETTDRQHCGCPQVFCEKCRGFSFNRCDQCMGAGIYQQCKECVNGSIITKKIVTVNIDKTNLQDIVVGNTVVHVKLKKSRDYFVENNRLYYRFKISLKESLVGFTKTFKDPFDTLHQVVSQTIIKPNDGYFINENLYLLFEIVYPNRLLTELKKVNF